MSTDNRLRLIKLIHVARRELGMDDDTYRLLLSGMKGLGGATSTADLSVPNLYRVLEQLKQRGFKVRSSKKQRPLAADDQSKKIRALWLALHGAGEEQRVLVDVVGDNHIRVGEHCAGDAFIGRINAAGHLLGRHAVGIDDGSIFVVGMLQHDAALVEAE